MRVDNAPQPTIEWGGWDEEQKKCGSKADDVAWPNPIASLMRWSMQHNSLFVEQDSSSDSWHNDTRQGFLTEEVGCVAL